MEYDLKIVRYVEDPDYKIKYDRWEEKNRYQSYNGYDVCSAPNKFLPDETLSVRINSDQFEAIRKAVLEKF